jgi:predicted TPR repeat methyltransferase
MDKSIDFKKQGDFFVSKGDLVEAEKFYRNAVALDPNYTDAVVSLAFVLYDSENYEQAQLSLIKALELTSTNADVYFMLGSIYHAQSNINEALKNIELAIQINPDFQFAYRKLFQILIEQNSFDLLKTKAQQVLNIFPNSAEYRFYLAEACYNLTNYKEAVEEYKKVLVLQPDAFPAHINLGNAYSHLNEYFEAMKSYNNALKLEHDSFDSHFGLAKVNFKAGYLDIALQHYKKCFAIQPQNVELYINFGDNLFNSGNTKDGISYLKKATEIDPSSIPAHHELGNRYLELKDNTNALKEYKKVLEIEPSHHLSYLVATLEGTNLNVVPKDYVEKLFDNYALNFEESLVGQLKYNAPMLIKDILTPLTNSSKRFDILDLGCGTGLMGELLKPSIKTLVGVDLSSRMLEKASEKNAYTRLEKKDILEMIKKEKDDSYDVIVSSDVFIYVGNLDLIFPEIFRLVRDDGSIVFSVEALEHTEHKGDFYLHQSGRYAHSLSYITRLAQESGYEIKQCLTQQIRLEQEQPVIGHIIELKKIV